MKTVLTELKWVMFLSFCFSVPCVFGQSSDKVAPANYDESKIVPYTLPAPLLGADGRMIENARQWTDGRRNEILNLFYEHMYGKEVLPAAKIRMSVRSLDSASALDGKAVRHQFRLVFHKTDLPTSDDPEVDFLLYVPKTDHAAGPIKPFPVFLSLNFMGNHAINEDPGIRLKAVWERKSGTEAPKPADEESRGVQSRRWPLETILGRGYAVGTVYYGDFEPDFNGGARYGVRRLIYGENEKQAPDEANAIGTWAWGLSRLLDVLVEHRESLSVDPAKAIVLGHSRLGKTSLWAGAIDPRFAIVISNNSGCGGAALSRRNFGETVHRINVSFPHWFCDNFKNYNHAVDTLPVDQHELVALIAPRPVYIASASEDRWADPKGEFLSALHADPVYKLLGTDGLAGVTEMPEPETPVGGRIGYHLRQGKHDILEYDWTRFMDFADKHLSVERP